MKYQHLYIVLAAKCRYDESRNGSVDKSDHNKVSVIPTSETSSCFKVVRRADADWGIGDHVEFEQPGTQLHNWDGRTDCRYTGRVVGYQLLDLPRYWNPEVFEDPSPFNEIEIVEDGEDEDREED